VADPLAIYLTDHFAGATFGVELVRRCRRNNEGSGFAAPLDELTREIEADRSTLLALMRRLDVRPSLVKTAAGWGLEKACRLKPNGRPLTYTPLARVAELELLASGIVGKRAMWRALGARYPEDARLAGFDFQRLAERADAQYDRAELLRLEAAALAFGPT
jgi:hypothetical protein